MQSANLTQAEVVKFHGRGIITPFNTFKTTPITLMCGQCNTRMQTELKVKKVLGCCNQPVHVCSNCGYALAYVKQSACCNVFWGSLGWMKWFRYDVVHNWSSRCFKRQPAAREAGNVVDLIGPLNGSDNLFSNLIYIAVIQSATLITSV